MSADIKTSAGNPLVADFLELLEAVERDPQGVHRGGFTVHSYYGDGAAQFGVLCEDPAHEITRSEIQLCDDYESDIGGFLGPHRHWVSLGPGAANIFRQKDLFIIGAAGKPQSITIVDISECFGEAAVQVAKQTFPDTEIKLLIADFKDLNRLRFYNNSVFLLMGGPASNVRSGETFPNPHMLEFLAPIQRAVRKHSGMALITNHCSPDLRGEEGKILEPYIGEASTARSMYILKQALQAGEIAISRSPEDNFEGYAAFNRKFRCAEMGLKTRNPVDFTSKSGRVYKIPKDALLHLRNSAILASEEFTKYILKPANFIPQRNFLANDGLSSFHFCL